MTATAPPAPASAPPSRGGGDGQIVIALVIGLVALGLAVAGGLVAVNAMHQADEASTEPPVEVVLSELAIAPEVIEAGQGAVLQVRNEGTLEHNLAVVGTDLATPMIGAGDQAELELGDLEAGTYEVICEVAGHESGGMVGELRIGAGGSTATGGDGAGATGGHDMTPQEMDEMMAERTAAFPAETEGTGGEILEATVADDGTKVFELTAEVVQWELEPGKTVEAWTYNGVVPGPTISVDDGDRIRIVLRNELPESTSIHFHGLLTPNDMDGVPDITQPPVEPGESFTYEFVARGPAVGMYHSHHNAAEQVPNGLAASILVGDIPLPGGGAPDQEVPMMLNDAGTIGFSLNGKSFPATAPVVVERGQRVLVHYLNEGLQAHPMHLHGQVQRVVAKDGIPLDQPYDADTVVVSPGERYSVLVTADEPGTWAWHCHILNHAEREDGMFGMVTAMVVE